MHAVVWAALQHGRVRILFVAFIMFDHAKDSRESWKCVPYLTVSLPLPVVGLWAACRLADQPSSGNGVGLLLGVVLGVLLFAQVWPRLSPAWVSNYLTLEERYSEPSDWKPKDGLLPPYWMRAYKNRLSDRPRHERHPPAPEMGRTAR